MLQSQYIALPNLSVSTWSTNQSHPNKGYLKKALAIAELRSPSRDDGTIARILFKMARRLRTRADVARKILTRAGEGHVMLCWVKMETSISTKGTMPIMRLFPFSSVD